MNVICILGFHKWQGCKCQKCGKVRSEAHDWRKDCEKCARCGSTRPNVHGWIGCKCPVCGKTRDEKHDWSKDCEKCSRCGSTRSNAHGWVGCKCPVCSKTRDEKHDWSKDCEKCSRCGKAAEHKWIRGCKCSVCGKIRDEGHDWSQDCEKCSVCGQTRNLDETLLAAAKARDVAEVRQLVTAGANINRLIHMAVPFRREYSYKQKGESLNAAELLLDAGADIDGTDDEGNTLLMKACLTQNVELVEYLLRKGASTQLKDRDGLTAFGLVMSWAINGIQGYGEVRAILAESTEDGQLWLQSSEGRAWKLSHADNPATPLSVSWADWGVVYNAITTNDDGKLRRIMRWVEAGGNLEWRTPNGWTLLHLAAMAGNEPMTRFFLDHGANIEARSERGETPLFMACGPRGWVTRLNPCVVALLLDRGADVYAKDSNGVSPLASMKAWRTDNAREIVALLKAGHLRRDCEGLGTVNGPRSPLEAELMSASALPVPETWETLKLWNASRTFTVRFPSTWRESASPQSSVAHTLLTPPYTCFIEISGEPTFSPCVTTVAACGGELHDDALLDKWLATRGQQFDGYKLHEASRITLHGTRALAVSHDFTAGGERWGCLMVVAVIGNALWYVDASGLSQDVLDAGPVLTAILASLRDAERPSTMTS